MIIVWLCFIKVTCVTTPSVEDKNTNDQQVTRPDIWEVIRPPEALDTLYLLTYFNYMIRLREQYFDPA